MNTFTYLSILSTQLIVLERTYISTLLISSGLVVLVLDKILKYHILPVNSRGYYKFEVKIGAATD